MAILLELKPDVEARLQAEAEANGLPLADFAGRLMSLASECQALPLLDRRSADEIVGYDDDGLPHRFE